MNQFRELMKRDIQRGIGSEEKVAVALSGGIDSTCCLLACLDLELDVTAYTFYLDGHESQDLHAAQQITRTLGVNLREVTVPYSLDSLQTDVAKIIREYRTARKTAVQCIHPFMYLIPQISEQTIISGLYADDLYGTSKNGAIIGNRNKEEFDKFRLKSIRQQDYSCVYIKEAVKRSGRELITPFVGGELQDYLMSLTWGQMNKPRVKDIAIKAFWDYYGKYAWYRKNSNLQVNSGIREYHDLLIASPLNKNKRASVNGIYNDILRAET